MSNLKRIIVGEIVGKDCQIITVAHHAAELAVTALRQPDPPDAEVWRCPCCKQIVDLDVMAEAKTKE